MNNTFKKYLPSLVYGGSDGAVSYFSLMAGAYGAGVPLKILIAIGISNVMADGLSMASADYLSEDSKNQKNTNPLFDAFFTFISFVLLGLIPLMPTLYAYNFYGPDSLLSFYTFIVSTLVTLCAFIFIGYVRGKVLKRNLFRTILQSVFICSASATVAYFVGEYVAKILI